MISALAEAGAVLERADYLDAARELPPTSCCGELRDDDGRLLRTWKDGRAKLNAYLEDHAFLLEALLTLYEASFEPRWFAAARALADTMIERFADDEHGGFFETSSDHEQLVARRKDLEDHPIPSGNASAAYGLLRLAALTGEHEYERARRCRCCGCCTSSPPRTRRPSATCSRRSTSTSPPCARSRWWATTREPLERVVRGALPPAPRAGRRRGRRRAAARGPRRRSTAAPAAYVCEQLRLQGAGDRAGRSSRRLLA